MALTNHTNSIAMSNHLTVNSDPPGLVFYPQGMIEDELKNVQNLINITTEAIKRVIKLIGDKQHPPALYVEEYTELTEKLSSLQQKKDDLVDRMSNGRTSPSPQPSPLPVPATKATVPKSPHSNLVRVWLPNQQRTTIVARKGFTLRESLFKAMSRRGYSPDTCLVYRKESRVPVDWDMEILWLEEEELVVEVHESFQATSSISHNFVRKTFFTLAFCDSCRRLLFHGFKCQTCGYKFHQRCAQGVPALCVSDNFYKIRFNRGTYNYLKVYSHPIFTQDSVHIPLLRLLGIERNGTVGGDTGGPAHLEPDIEQNDPGMAMEDMSLSSHSAMSEPQTIPKPTLPRERSISAPSINLVIGGADNSQMLEELVAKHNKATMGQSGGHDMSGRPLPNSPSKTRQTSGSCTPTPSRDGVFDYSPASIIRGYGSTVSSSLPNSISNSIISPNKVSISSPNSLQPSPTHQPKRRSQSSSDEVRIRRNRHRRDSNDDWEIPANEIVIGPRIGSGSFGTVYRGQWHGAVAVKKLNVTDPTPSQLQAFKNEVAVLRKTRHANILLFMGCTSKPELAIVTQWCESSSLYKHLHVIEVKFEMHDLIDIARQSAQGMDYLHAKNIIHRDLKSNNIFLHDDMTVKIGDFGLATVKSRWSGSERIEQPTGSILWMAPEVIRMQDPNPYTPQSDVYAFGVVLYELVTGQLPYSNINNKDQIIWMVGRGYLSPNPEDSRSDTPKAFKRLMSDCCKKNRDERPLFPQVLASLESLARSLPKLHRSASEPVSLNRTRLHADDLLYNCPSPKTPLQSQFPTFAFFPTGSNL
ncbi:serine/threonine-protein kinase B-raf-like isoform X3 [Ptychodera flava]|uniref:serine/threonine-protein kinase B-raf-like isoform X3 n=1 Tax=Ptychodera flava TaxID=63121 RepID=UPI00396AB094